GMRYHIVAHSHGGNVVLGALESMPEDPKRLGAVVFLGTPVLQFSKRSVSRSVRYIPMVTYLTGFAIAAWVSFASHGVWSAIAILLTVVLAFAVFIDFGGLSKKPLPKRRKRASVYGRGHPYAYIFASDEAVGGLSKTLEVMEKPSHLIKQLLA